MREDTAEHLFRAGNSVQGDVAAAAYHALLDDYLSSARRPLQTEQLNDHAALEIFRTSIEKSPVKTPEELGANWDLALAAGKFDNENRDLAEAVRQAYDKGGMKAVRELEDQINQHVVAENSGPVFVKRGDKIEIHNVKVFVGAQADSYRNLSADDKATLGVVELDDEVAKELGKGTSVDLPGEIDKTGGKLDAALSKDEDRLDQLARDGKLDNYILNVANLKKVVGFIENFEDDNLNSAQTKLARIIMAATIIGGNEGEGMLAEVKDSLAPLSGVNQDQLLSLSSDLRDRVLWDKEVHTNMSILNHFVGDMGGSLIE